jgi:hypothetical protein
MRLGEGFFRIDLQGGPIGLDRLAVEHRRDAVIVQLGRARRLGVGLKGFGRVRHLAGPLQQQHLA